MTAWAAVPARTPARVEPDPSLDHRSTTRDVAVVRPAHLVQQLFGEGRKEGEVLYISAQTSSDSASGDESSDSLASLIFRVEPAQPNGTAHTHLNGRPEAEESEERNGEQQVTISIPASLAARFGDTAETVIGPHHPIVLTHVFLAALSPEAFTFAQASQEAVSSALDGRIVRQGDQLTVQGAAFRVVMTEPVLQGLALTGRGDEATATEMFVTLSHGDEEEESVDKVLVNGGTSAPRATREVEDVAIDERFLAQNVLDDFTSDVGEEDAGEGDVSISAATAAAAAARFTPRPLESRAVVIAALAKNGVEDFDEENCVLLDESGLAHLGAFEGDWALAELAGQHKSRVVKLFAVPSLLARSIASGSRSTVDPLAYLSPGLLRNLFADASFDPLRPYPSLILRGLRTRVDEGGDSIDKQQKQGMPLADCPLPLPFADALSISRVAGPLSINRAYQPLFLNALRSYFEGRRRVVKEGDIVSVAFDSAKVRWTRSSNEGEESSDDKTANAEDNTELNLPGADVEKERPTAVVHFRVSSLTPELNEPDDGADDEGQQQNDQEFQLAHRARLGELGCVVDTSLTKIVQTGVDKTRVADVQAWLCVVTDTPPLPSAPSPLTSETSVYATLMRLVQATLLPHAASFGLHLGVLLKGARGSGKKTLARWVAQRAGVHLVEINCFDLIADTDARTEGVLRARFEQTASCAPAILLLQNVDALARKSQALETGQEPTMASVLQDCFEGLRQATASSNLPVAVFGTTSDADKCPTGVLGCFKHEVQIDAPGEAQRLAILETCLKGAPLSIDVNLASVATQTAALVAADLVDLVSRAKMASMERLHNVTGHHGLSIRDVDIVSAGFCITGKDFEVGLNKARQSYSESIGAPKIPNVTWDDVGGLASVKDDILDTIQLPLEHPELFSDGLKKRSGILLYGPPGTGKTLLAKAVATSCSLNFFSVKGPELLNMYIGESEANVRRVFQRARDAKPCVIFFDELDSVAPKRGNQGDSGGVMDRIVSQLLAELDGMASGDGSGDVFVIGATNRPDLLDPALLRPGRFDRMLYLSVSETHAAQLNILQALTRKFKLDADVGDLSSIADQCPLNLTGADFYALCSDAMLKAMTRKAADVDETIAALNAAPQGQRDAQHPWPITPQYYLAEMARPQEVEVKVARVDFEAALRELVPSVSEREMEHYREVQKKFSAPSTEEEVAAGAGKGEGKENGKGKGKGKGKAIEQGGGQEGERERMMRELVEGAAREMNIGEGAVAAGSGVGDGVLAPPIPKVNGSHAPADGPAAASNGAVEEPQSKEKPNAKAAAAEARRKAKGKGKAKE